MLDAEPGPSSSSSLPTATWRRRASSTTRLAAVPQRRTRQLHRAQRRRRRRHRSRSPRSTSCRRRPSTPTSNCRPAASATSRPATARRCRSTSCCPARPRPAPTRPWSSTPATSRPTPTAVGFPPAVHRPRLRLRRRQHARQRLQRRLVPVLRGRPAARRLRRHRDDRRRAVGRSATAVGMVGVSYPGISQLFVAATQPPSLAAITPLSVIDDSYRGVLYPGGILNTGFARRVDAARMDSTTRAAGPGVGGRPHRRRRHRVRGQPAPAAAEPGPRRRDRRATRSGPTELGDPLAPRTFVDQIEVPVLPRRRVAGRADRRPLRHDARPVHRHRPLLRHARQRPAHRVDRAPACSPGSSSSSTSTSPSASRRWPSPGRRRRSSPATIFGTDEVDAAARPVRRPDLRASAGRVRVRAADPGAVRGGRRRRRAARHADAPLVARSSSRGRSPA